MICHVLNGDALASSFPATGVPGEILVAREALVTGDLTGEVPGRFWQARAASLHIPPEEYLEKSASQFEAILNAPPGTEFNLWFEFDLFCQVNLWFVLSLIDRRLGATTVYAVYTGRDKSSPAFWNGMGPATSQDLKRFFKNRTLFSPGDVALGARLWNAYKKNDLPELQRLSTLETVAFPYLAEVVRAHTGRFPGGGQRSEPEEFIASLFRQGTRDFDGVFAAFRKEKGIYGFGDLQVKELFDRVVSSSP